MSLAQILLGSSGLNLRLSRFLKSPDVDLTDSFGTLQEEILGRFIDLKSLRTLVCPILRPYSRCNKRVNLLTPSRFLYLPCKVRI